MVAARAEGRIVDLPVEAGERVTKGQLIARIDERAAAQSVAEGRAQVARAEADLANARANFDRTQRLVAEKFVSAATLDKARADFDAAKAQLAAAQAGADRAVTSRDYTVVTAPFSGVVAVRHVQVGEMAQPGKPLVTVYDPVRAARRRAGPAGDRRGAAGEAGRGAGRGADRAAHDQGEAA